MRQSENDRILWQKRNETQNPTKTARRSVLKRPYTKRQISSETTSTPPKYKHVVLGLIFLKYISDTFEERYNLLRTESANPQSDLYVPDETARVQLADDRDEYLAENIFYVPQEARWSYLQADAKRPEIGSLIDKAMIAIEGENPSLKGVLPKNYARPMLDKRRLGELVDLIGTIGLGDEENRSKDILGRVYEYFLSTVRECPRGKRGGQFYTPRCVVQVLVEMLAPYKGRVVRSMLRIRRHVCPKRSLR